MRPRDGVNHCRSNYGVVTKLLISYNRNESLENRSSP